MTNGTERHLIPAEGPQVEPIKIGFDLLTKLSENAGESMDAILLIPIKQNIQDATLERALGSNMTKALLKGEPVRLPSGGNLKLRTERTFRALGTSDIIMAVYVTKRMLNQIDSARNARAIIVVPWAMDDMAEWRRVWNPHVYGEEPTDPEVLIENPVIEEALKMLTYTVNLSTGLLNPSDKSATVELFRLLFENGEVYDHDSVRAWALRNGWTPDGADQLREVAQAILNRRRIRAGAHPHWRPNIIEILRERVEEDRRS